MEEIKFPVIFPRKGHVTDLIIKYFHEKVQHQGRGMSLNEIRSNGFWVIGGTSAVAYVISKCVTCPRWLVAREKPPRCSSEVT